MVTGIHCDGEFCEEDSGQKIPRYMILRQNIYRHTNSETESSQKENSQKALLWENSPKSYKYWYKSLTGTIESYNKTTFVSKELWCSG